MRSREYTAFIKAHNDIDVHLLSDNELKEYTFICDNALIEAKNELYKRGL